MHLLIICLSFAPQTNSKGQFLLNAKKKTSSTLGQQPCSNSCCSCILLILSTHAIHIARTRLKIEKIKKALQEQKQLLFLAGYRKLTSSVIITLLTLKTHLTNGFAFEMRKVHKAPEFLGWDINAIILWLKGSKTWAEGCIRITSDYVLPRLYQCCNQFLPVHR